MTEIIEYLFDKVREIRSLAVNCPEIAEELRGIAAELEQQAAELENES